MPCVGRAFMVRRFLRRDVFNGRWWIEDVGPEGADLRRLTRCKSGLYGPTGIPSRSDICKGPRSMCQVSDLKVPTYED